jgi:trans-aconitate methyltransferase
MAVFLWIFFIVAGGIFLCKLVYLLSTVLVLPATQGALFVTTSQKRIAAVLDAVPMKPTDLLVDLGCGDGRVLRAAKERYGVRTLGFELNPLPYFKARLSGGCIQIRRKDFFKADLSDADVIFCYLFPDVMRRLAAKLQSELKPGTIVISCNFPLPDRTTKRIVRPDGALHHDPIYIYDF